MVDPGQQVPNALSTNSQFRAIEPENFVIDYFKFIRSIKGSSDFLILKTIRICLKFYINCWSYSRSFCLTILWVPLRLYESTSNMQMSYVMKFCEKPHSFTGCGDSHFPYCLELRSLGLCATPFGSWCNSVCGNC